MEQIYNAVAAGNSWLNEIVWGIGGHPQPEDGACAAQGDGGGDTGNITGANGSGQGCGQSLD